MIQRKRLSKPNSLQGKARSLMDTKPELSVLLWSFLKNIQEDRVDGLSGMTIRYELGALRAGFQNQLIGQ